MSDVMEQEQMMQRPRPGTVPLSVLVEFICQKVYTDLMRLVDLLPSKTDMEKKIEIATFFSRTRHLFIRLEALVKWSNSASKVDKCEKISNFLEEQSFFLINTANSLSRLLRETLVGARLPPFAVLLAIDVFTNKSYTRLPKSISHCATPTETICNRQLKQALLDLNRIIQNRLSLTQIPRQFKIIKIVNGRVHFVVPYEFQVTLTLMSEALDFPWRVLDVKFLVKNVTTNDQNLVHPLQLQFIQNQVQSRLLYRTFDKRPPLLHLYDMLHAFSISLQLDVLHEQAQRARARRPTDQLVVEVYKPGQNLLISYWHALSRAQFQAQLGLDGKLLRTAYLLSIHVDPTDPQRPLCISHRPELSQTESHRIGTILQGNCLSFEKLLARTVTARAEQMLWDLRQELMVLSPGPVRISDAPLCLSVPLLWPCHPQELLQIRVDPIQGALIASCPYLVTSEAEAHSFGLQSVHSMSSNTPDSYSPASVCAALISLQNALNRPSTRRICPVASGPTSTTVTTGESSLLVAQSRSLRTLSHTETRWRSTICEALDHLRLCVGVVRLMHTAKQHRPFWQPVKRSLPIVLTSTQASMAVNSTSWPAALIRLQQASQWPIVFVRLFPNNEFYLACEVVTTSLNVTYRYWLLVCTALPDHIEVAINAHGLSVANIGQNLPSSTLPSASGLFLRITHLVPIDVGAIWLHNPSSSLFTLQSFAKRAREMVLKKRKSRVAALLNNKTRSESKMDSASESSLDYMRPCVPSLTRLIGRLEESILINYFSLEFARAGVVHSGIQFDANGCLSAIQIISLPNQSPSWQAPGVVPLSQHVRQIVLRPHFDPFTHRRSWQLDILFVGIVHAPGQRASSEQLRHQTTEWFVTRLEDFGMLVKYVLAEWDSLCCMHALCCDVVRNPGLHLPPTVSFRSYNLQTLSLVYNTNYLADISYRSESGYTVALGFTPNPQLSTHEIGSPLESVTEVDSNPHMFVRHHLEELLNASKSITFFAKTLVHTLAFMRALEPLRDRTLSNHGLKASHSNNALRTVRGMVLIALSAHDLVLVYRASLALRITLCPQRSTSASALVASAASTASQETVVLADACRLLVDPFNNYPVDSWPPHGNDSLLGGLVPLPAFQIFLNTLQEAYQMDIEECWTGLMVSQLSQLTRPSRALSKRGERSKPSRSSPYLRSSLSPLESYLSASLLFHGCIAAVRSLDIPVLSSQDSGVGETDVGGETVVNRLSDIIRAGSFEAHWVSSCLSTYVCLVPQRTGVEVASWKVTLRLSTFIPPNSGSLDRWPQETLSLMEEFFDNRVCAPPFQPSAVTAFFRLLVLPPRACRGVVRLFALDLHPPTHTPVVLRLGLVGLGSSKRLGVGSQQPGRGTSMTNSPHGSLDAPQPPELIPGLPGILVRPPRITLQLLILRHQRQQISKFPGAPMAQLILIGYDWDANRVAILTNSAATQGTRSTDSGPTIPQLLLESDMEVNANLMASNSGDSALVQLAMLITQTPASTYAPSLPGPVQTRTMLNPNA